MMETYLMDATIEELQLELLKRKGEQRKILDSMPKQLKKIDWDPMLILLEKQCIKFATDHEQLLDDDEDIAITAFECAYGSKIRSWLTKVLG